MKNGYLLTKSWFEFAFENPDMITVHHTALFMWLIECNNRKGFADKFPFNTDDAILATGIKDRKTIWKALSGLEEMKFVFIVTKAKNQSQLTVLSLNKTLFSGNGALNRSLANSEACLSLPSPSEGTALPLADTQALPLALPPSLKLQTTNKDNNIPRKKMFAEKVTLTDEENNRLLKEFGKDMVDACYKYLSEYKIEKGYKSKSDNLTIRRWVIEAVTKKFPELKNQSENGQLNFTSKTDNNFGIEPELLKNK